VTVQEITPAQLRPGTPVADGRVKVLAEAGFALYTTGILRESVSRSPTIRSVTFEGEEEHA